MVLRPTPTINAHYWRALLRPIAHAVVVVVVVVLTLLLASTLTCMLSKSPPLFLENVDIPSMALYGN